MKRIIAGILTLGLLGIAQPAHAAVTLDNFVPTARNIFNTPRAAGGTTAQQYGFGTFIERTLDSMAPGAVARMAVYDLNVPSTADAIIRSHKRGVNVRVIFDKLDRGEEQRVAKALGGNVKAGSYAIACENSCNSATESAMHNKMFTFSSTGSPQTARQITVIGSANLTTTNQYLNWNATQVLTDPTIYSGVAHFIDQMRYDRDDNSVYSTPGSADGRYRAYLWPAGTTSANPYLAALKSIKASQCRNVAGGYGNSSRRTVVRVEMFLWTATRKAEATELVRLHKAGCDVAVLYTNNQAALTMAQSVADILWNGGVPMYNTFRDFDRNGSFDLYTHGKSMIVNGTLYGKANKVVWNGSANWTGTALVHGNEVAVRTDHNPTYDAFKKRADQIQKLAVRDTRRPITTPPKTSAQRQSGESQPLGDDFENLDQL